MTQLCIGGGSVPNATTAQLLAAFDVSGPFPLTDQQYQTFASDNAPDGFTCTGTCDGESDVGSYGWYGMAVACLKTRQLLFCTKTPGDIAAASYLSSTQQAQTVQQLSTAVSGAAGAANSVLSSIKSLAPSIPVIGAAISQIGSIVGQIFAAHAAAVKTQDQVLSTLCPSASLGIAQIDAAYRLGSISASQAVGYIQSLMVQFNTAVAPYSHSCNAFCFYSAIFAAILEATPTVYATASFQQAGNPASPLQAPITSGALPGTSPTEAMPVATVAPTVTAGIASLSTNQIALLGIGVAVIFGILTLRGSK